jgi:serine/threonine-protein kinase HipA
MSLHVYAGGVLVGLLSQSDDSYDFEYLEHVDPTLSVSLRMPTSQRLWRSRELFPAFQVSMPEGWLLRQVKGSLSESGLQATPLRILEAVGVDMVGDLQFRVQAPGAPRAAPAGVDGRVGTDGELSPRTRQWPGISGGFPKALRKRKGETGYWIWKADDEDHAGLSLIEYFGMRVSSAAGLPTPEIRLSEDGKSLWVRRFDVGPSGERLAYEDMCSLLGLPASGKYDGSVERVVRVIKEIVAPHDVRQASETLYARYLLAAAIRNGDAHLKNFGLLYPRGGAPEVAPVFDMLTMAAYAPRRNDGDAHDGMALMLRGSRRWPSRDDLDALAHLCEVSTGSRIEWCRRIWRAIKKVAEDAHKMAHDIQDPAASQRLVRMCELWRIGAHSLLQSTDSDG